MEKKKNIFSNKDKAQIPLKIQYEHWCALKVRGKAVEVVKYDSGVKEFMSKLFYN